MEKSIFTFAFFILAPVLLIFFVSPKYQEVADLRTQIKEREIVLQYKEEYFRNLYNLEKELEGYKEPLQKVNSALPGKDPDLPSLFDFLQKAVSENGLVLEKIGPFSVYSPGTGGELGEAHLQLSVQGPYLSFENFLVSLEKSARLIGVEKLSFSSPEKGETFKFDLRIKVYYVDG